jgi:hypothetical protein
VLSADPDILNSRCHHKCVDCGTIFLTIIDALIPRPREEQEHTPLCLRCFQRRLEVELLVLSEQLPRPAGGDVL